MKITISVVGNVSKVEIEVPGGTVEVHEQTPAAGTKPANPALDLSKPYPLPAYPVSSIRAKAEEIAQRVPAPADEAYRATVAVEPSTAPPPRRLWTLTKADLARSWGHSLKKGPRSRSQKSEDAAWEAAGKPTTETALDAHGKQYQTNPDGTALFADAAVSEEEPETGTSEGHAEPPEDEFAAAPAEVEEDEFGPPTTKAAPIAVAQDIPGVPPEVFQAVEVRDILKPLAAANMSKAQILAFLETNHQKLKPIARLSLEAMLPKMSRALDQLKVS